MQSNEQAVAEIEQELRDHKSHATEAQTFYRETTAKCLEMWKDLEALMAKTSLSSEQASGGASIQEAHIYINHKCRLSAI